MMSARMKASIFGTQTSAPVALRDGRDGADVVEVRVREEDAVELDAQGIDRSEQLVGLVAGVDDQRAIRAVAAEDVRVLRDLADREHPHVHG